MTKFEEHYLLVCRLKVRINGGKKQTNKQQIQKQLHISVSCCVYTVRYPFCIWQCATPSLFLLLEKKLQRCVPLIAWKAVRQLAVIQRLGNFAQTEKNKFIISGVQQIFFFPLKILKNNKSLHADTTVQKIIKIL